MSCDPDFLTLAHLNVSPTLANKPFSWLEIVAFAKIKQYAIYEGDCEFAFQALNSHFLFINLILSSRTIKL